MPEAVINRARLAMVLDLERAYLGRSTSHGTAHVPGPTPPEET